MRVVPQLTVPMLAVSVGGVVNLLMTRGHELRRGVAVEVRPSPCSSSSSSPWTCRAPRTLCRGVPRPPGPQAADGTPLGESVAAARIALLQCSAARVVSPLVESATYPA